MKVTLELRGFSSFVYLDRMSSVKVAAGDVKKRIGNPSAPKPICETISACEETTTTGQVPALSTDNNDVKDKQTEKAAVKAKWKFLAFIPSIALTLTEDIDQPNNHRPLLCILLDDLLLQSTPAIDNNNSQEVYVTLGSAASKLKLLPLLQIQPQVNSTFPFNSTVNLPKLPYKLKWTPPPQTLNRCPVQ